MVLLCWFCFCCCGCGGLMTSQACNDMPAQPLKTIVELGHHTQQELHHSIGEGGWFCTQAIWNEKWFPFWTQEWIWVMCNAKHGEEQWEVTQSQNVQNCVMKGFCVGNNWSFIGHLLARISHLSLTFTNDQLPPKFMWQKWHFLSAAFANSRFCLFVITDCSRKVADKLPISDWLSLTSHFSNMAKCPRARAHQMVSVGMTIRDRWHTVLPIIYIAWHGLQFWLFQNGCCEREALE